MGARILPTPAILDILPQDILISIMYFMDPRGLIACRQTCKALQQCSTVRSVWIAALHRISVQYDIYRGTYKSMETMTLRALEIACLSPDKFWSLSQKNSQNNNVIIPSRSQILSPQPKTRSRVECFSLVPGGRYVFTTSQSRDLELWDLGIPGTCPMLSDPVAALTLPCPPDSFMPDVIPTPDGLGLRVLITFLLVSTFTVYEVFPQSAKPQLRAVNTMNFMLYPQVRVFSYSIHPEVCIFHVSDLLSDHDGVVIWDYIRCAQAFLAVPSLVHDNLHLGKYIALLDNDGVSVRRVPTLTPVADASEPFQDFEWTVWDLVSSAPHPIGVDAYSWGCWWRTGKLIRSKRIEYLQAFYMQDELLNIVRHHLVLPVSDGEDDLPKIVVQHLTVPNLIIPAITELRCNTLAFSNGNDYLTIARGEETICIVTSQTADPAQENQSGTIDLPHVMLMTSLTVDNRTMLDPVMARACVLDLDGNIVINDYVVRAET